MLLTKLLMWDKIRYLEHCFHTYFPQSTVFGITRLKSVLVMQFCHSLQFLHSNWGYIADIWSVAVESILIWMGWWLDLMILVVLFSLNESIVSLALGCSASQSSLCSQEFRANKPFLWFLSSTFLSYSFVAEMAFCRGILLACMVKLQSFPV